jgi:two-component system LytT family response regulator
VSSLKAVVVDDEQLAREELCYMLDQMGNVEVIAQAGNGLEAVGIVERLAPDVLFLDVQMPEVDGFEVLRRLDSGSVPAVIFVTAFDRYALQAFEQHALDYLLKPFSDERFAVVLDRTRVRLREHSFASMAAGLPDLLSAMAPERRQLVVRDGGRTVVIPHDDIVWIEAEDYCARIHTRGRTILVRDSLRALADALEPNGFVRAHRSAIVNIAHVREIEPLTSGDQRVTLSDGTPVKVSRTYRAGVVEAIAHR